MFHIDKRRETAHTAREIASQVRRRRRRRTVLASGAIAALAIAALAIAGLWSGRFFAGDEIAAPAPHIAAVVSKPERRELSDGSIAELKPGAELAIEYAPEVRRVRLQRGEAHFQVAKDAARPFVVVASALRDRGSHVGRHCAQRISPHRQHRGPGAVA